MGDAIAEGDILCEIETDKLTNEFESPKAGVLLNIIAGDGATVTCLEPIAVIGEANEDISGLLSGSAAPHVDEVAAPVDTPLHPKRQLKQRVGGSMLLRWLKKLAKEKGN